MTRSRTILAALALCAFSSLATAEAPLQYDQDLADRQERMLGLYVRTRQCLNDAGRAMLRQGVREPEVIKLFMVKMCGDPFYGLLRHDGMPEEQARRTVVELTEEVLREDILHSH